MKGRSVISTLLIGTAMALLFRSRRKNRIGSGMLGRSMPKWMKARGLQVAIARIASMINGRRLMRRLVR